MRTIYRPKGPALEYAELALNPFAGCRHGCRYCYVPTMPGFPSRDHFHARSTVRRGFFAALRDQAARIAGDQRHILITFTADPCQSYQHSMVTLECVRILHRHGLRVNLLTKGIIPTELLRELWPSDRVGISLTTMDPLKARTWEPRSAAPLCRLTNLQLARDQGPETWLSLEPVIDPEESLAALMKCGPSIRGAKIGKLNHAGRVDWPSDRDREAFEAIGPDQWAAFCRSAELIGEELEIGIIFKESLKRYAPA